MIILYILLILLIIYLIFILFKCFKYHDFKMFSYFFLKYPLGLIFKFYYPYKTYYKENIINKGPVIYASNHIHLMDQCLVILNTKIPIHYMAKIEYFNNYKTRWFFKLVGCIPVNREIHDNNAKDMAMNVLQNKKALGIFPEGTRNKTKEILLPFKFGAVSLAKKNNATIVPVAVSGTYKFKTKDLKIKFGEPFKVDDLSLEEANNLLYQRIIELLQEDK